MDINNYIIINIHTDINNNFTIDIEVETMILINNGIDNSFYIINIYKEIDIGLQVSNAYWWPNLLAYSQFQLTT